MVASAEYYARRDEERQRAEAWLRGEYAEETLQGISDPHAESFQNIAVKVIAYALMDEDDDFLFSEKEAYVILRDHWFAQAGFHEPTPQGMWALVNRWRRR